MIVYIIVMYIGNLTVQFEHLGRYQTALSCDVARLQHNFDADVRGVIRGPTACIPVIR